MTKIKVVLKRCSKCGESKGLFSFGKDKSKKDGLCSMCKLCNKEHMRPIMRKYMLPRQEQKRIANTKYYLKTVYNITPDEYNSMLDKQGRVCEICGTKENFGKNMSIDHCHKTGEIRGLLCTRCNAMLGQALDSTEILQSAINYLVKHSNT